MSSAAIVAATQSILQAALTAAGETSFAVVQGVPKAVNTDTVLYLWHEGYDEAQKAGPGWVRRTHSIPIHLLVLSTGDDAAAEARLLALSDLIAGVFYTNRKLNLTAATSQLVQAGANSRLAQTQPYVLYANAEYRHRWWTLNAAEDLVYAFA